MSFLANTLSWHVLLTMGILRSQSFLGGSSGKECACQCRSHGFNPWIRKAPEVGNGNPLQYSCLENSMGRGAWWATVHGTAESQTRLSN